jgi:uncharacterized membrane protein YoaK (UPF0700 family)
MSASGFKKEKEKRQLKTFAVISFLLIGATFAGILVDTAFLHNSVFQGSATIVGFIYGVVLVAIFAHGRLQTKEYLI